MNQKLCVSSVQFIISNNMSIQNLSRYFVFNLLQRFQSEGTLLFRLQRTFLRQNFDNISTHTRWIEKLCV